MPTRRAICLACLALLALAGCAPQPTVPPPRPTVIVVTATGPYYVTFDDSSGWLTGSSDNSQGHVANGEYFLTINTPHYLAWANEQRAFGDGTYELDARLASGPEVSAFGLLLLGSSDLSSFFYCMITGDGRYDIGYCEKGCQTETSLIGGYTLAYPILPSGQANHLTVDLQAGLLRFSVNGAPIGQVRGLTYTRGLIGLVGESGPYAGFEAAFDNLHVIESATPEPTP